MMRRAWLVGSLVFFAPSLALAATYVVAPNGKDSNAGDAANPWLTLQHAADTVKAGDTVTVEPGDYAGFYVTTTGTKDMPITFSAKPGVSITSPNGKTNKDGINVEDTENGGTIAYVVVEGFTINNMPRAGIRSAVSSHITIRKNKTDQNGVWGIFTGFAEDVLIEDNECSRSGEQHGIYTSNSADRPIIRHNKIWGNSGAGIHMNGDVSQGGDGIISNALVEGNIIWDNGKSGGSGINCDGVQDSVFQNNLIYNEHASGISLYQGDAADASKNNKVVNNTILIASDGRWALNIREGASGNHLHNNILQNTHPFRGSIDIAMDALPGFVSDDNLMMDRFTLDGSTVIKLSDWQAQTMQDAASSTAAPKFVNAAADDYHSAPDSPAVDKGIETEAPSVDLEGVARPQGGAYDIGCYELCAAGNCQSGTGGSGGSSTGGGGAGGTGGTGGAATGGAATGGAGGTGGAATGGAGGAATGGAATGGAATGGTGGTGQKGSCGCRTAGIDPQDTGTLALVLAGLCATAARRRRPRR